MKIAKSTRVRLFIENEQGDFAVLVRARGAASVLLLPGGGVDEGETPEEALVREVAEELCVGLDTRLMALSHEFTVRKNRAEFTKFEQGYYPLECEGMEETLIFYRIPVTAVIGEMKLGEPEKFRGPPYFVSPEVWIQAENRLTPESDVTMAYGLFPEGKRHAPLKTGRNEALCVLDVKRQNLKRFVGREPREEAVVNTLSLSAETVESFRADPSLF